MDPGIIATFYRIDTMRPGPALQGGLAAHMVVDRREPTAQLIAIETRADLPARPRLTLARSGPAVPHAVLPVEYGSGHDLAGRSGFFVIGEAPPGQAVGLRAAWREADLLAFVLLPAAAALCGLKDRGVTHRAINPDNLFRAGVRDAVTLGPFWAAPPAALQPAVYEPPYMARCLPNARGDGSIADDVYALGVTLLALATGRIPLAELDDAGVLRRKLELGSFEALTAEAALTPLISDLLRGMLAEDPDHRPSPTLLARPEQARARRVAARPPRRAQVALDVGGMKVWSARELALALGLQWERGAVLLRSGDVERWLRRCLGDPQLGMRVEEIMRRINATPGEEVRLQPQVVMRCVAAIDPLAPLVWRGIAVQPDGIGPAVAGASPSVLASLQEIVSAEAVADFCTASYRKHDRPGLKEEQREWRAWLLARGPAGGVNRLSYGMNPMLVCASPLLAGRVVVRTAELLAALDAAAVAADRAHLPIDSHVAAFIAARSDLGLVGELTSLASFAGVAERLAVLRLFGRLQARLHPAPLPGLAAWLVASGVAGVADWHSHKTRVALAEALERAAANGQISEMVALLDDEPARRADRQGAADAAARVQVLLDALEGIRNAGPARLEAARNLGCEIVGGAGLLASLGVAMALALH